MVENAKTVVRIVKHTGAYVPGDIAGFDSAIADKLIQSGAAVGGTVNEETGEFTATVVAPAAARSEINDTVVKTAVPIEGNKTVDVDKSTVVQNASSQRGPRKAKADAAAAGEPTPPEATSAAEPVNLGQGSENADAEGEDDAGDDGDEGDDQVEKVDAASVDIPDDWEHLPATERKHMASLLAGRQIKTVADAAPIIRAEVNRREAQA